MAGLAAGQPAAAAPPERERVIVQFRDAAEAGAVAAEEERNGARIGHRFRRVLTGFTGELSRSRIEALRRDPDVAAVIPDVPAAGGSVQADPTWGLDRLDQRDAQFDGEYSYDTAGRGVTVYVVDSGVRLTHGQLAGRVRSGYDFVDDDADASDCHGHGTHVAGTIGGSRFGVAKQVEMVSLRVWGCDNGGWMSDMIAAIDWAVADRRGPSVINVSGGGAAYPLMDEAVARATAAGVPVVVAAMNDGSDACAHSPARAPGAVTVAATDAADRRAPFSNYGPCIDLFAPGVNVQSSTATSDTSSEYWNGTSMATPHVTGAVARYLETAPRASAGDVADWLQSSATPGVVTNALSERSGLLHVAPPSAVSVPGVPTQVTASTSGATASIAWQPPTDTGGSAVTGYRVSRDGQDAGGTGPWSTLVGASAKSHTFAKLVPGARYTLTVQAVNASGDGVGASRQVTTARVHEAFGSSAASFQVVRGGRWRVANGMYVLSAPSSANLPNANLSVHTTPVPGDFVLSAKGRTTATANASNDFSVVFGFADPSNYWFANFAERNDGTHSGVFRVSGGVRTQVADISGRISAGTMYPVRVERRGGAVRVFRSGALVAQAAVAAFPGDRVGFGSRNDGGAFDNLVVTR